MKSKYAQRVDGNQVAIVKELRQIPGVFVWCTRGTMDVVVGYRGVTYIVDFKSKGGRKTPSQKSMEKRWTGGPLLFATTIDPILEAMGIST